MCLPAVWGILSPRPGCTMEGLKMLLPRSWRWSSKVLQALALLADLGLLNVPGLLPLGYRGWVSSRQEGSCFAIGPKAALTSLWPGGDMERPLSALAPSVTSPPPAPRPSGLHGNRQSIASALPSRVEIRVRGAHSGMRGSATCLQKYTLFSLEKMTDSRSRGTGNIQDDLVTFGGQKVRKY